MQPTKGGASAPVVGETPLKRAREAMMEKPREHFERDHTL